MASWKPDSLLDVICEKSGFAFVSDLHIPDNVGHVQKVISLLKPEAFTVREWNEAVFYITGINKTFSDAKSAADFIRKQ